MYHTIPRGLVSLALTASLIVAAGCHQVKIDSGLEPGSEVHAEEWNMAFAAAIYPAQVDASTFCGGEWARVETKQSFLNLVVAVFTFGIITPMDVTVVCAKQPDQSGGVASQSAGEVEADQSAGGADRNQ